MAPDVKIMLSAQSTPFGNLGLSPIPQFPAHLGVLNKLSAVTPDADGAVVGSIDHLLPRRSGRPEGIQCTAAGVSEEV